MARAPVARAIAGIVFCVVAAGVTTATALRPQEAEAAERAAAAPPFAGPGGDGVCLSIEAAELARAVNEYRASHGLPPAPISPALTQVAQLHAADVPDPTALGSDDRGRLCSLHSWSERGWWTPLCYTPDHARAAGMWDKPREITGGRYAGRGFETIYWARTGATPARALGAWKRSASHDALIAETGTWRGARWPAMGVAIQGPVAALWFGDRPDAAGGPLPACLSALRVELPALERPSRPGSSSRAR